MTYTIKQINGLFHIMLGDRIQHVPGHYVWFRTEAEAKAVLNKALNLFTAEHGA